MTIFEWAEQGYRMEWAIYDAESQAAFNQRCKDEKLEGMDFCIAHDALVLDFRAPEGTPDGTHQVYHAGSRGSIGWGEGACREGRSLRPHADRGRSLRRRLPFPRLGTGPGGVGGRQRRH